MLPKMGLTWLWRGGSHDSLLGFDYSTLPEQLTDPWETLFIWKENSLMIVFPRSNWIAFSLLVKSGSSLCQVSVILSEWNVLILTFCVGLTFQTGDTIVNNLTISPGCCGSVDWALAGTESWLANYGVTGSIPSQGTCLGCGPGPSWGC